MAAEKEVGATIVVARELWEQVGHVIVAELIQEMILEAARSGLVLSPGTPAFECRVLEKPKRSFWERVKMRLRRRRWRDVELVQVMVRQLAVPR